jgi:hypothetical protein
MRSPGPRPELGFAADVPEEPADRSAAPRAGSADRLLVLALAGVLLVSTLAQMRTAASGTADVDVRVVPDAPGAVVLCVLDTTGQARCHGKDGVLSGTIDGSLASVCGIADRRLASPCAAGDCVFRGAASRTEVLGLIVLDARPPLFGMPRHRLVDATVLSPAPPPTPLTEEMARAVERVARCFAPSGETPEGPPAQVLFRRGCASSPCRLQHSSLQLVASARPQ